MAKPVLKARDHLAAAQPLDNLAHRLVVVRVNLLGTAAAVRAALPHLEASGGRVVTVASSLSLKGVSDATAYCASKFGVLGFSRALAAETKGRIGVTTLIPGGMSTNVPGGATASSSPKKNVSSPSRM